MLIFSKSLVKYIFSVYLFFFSHDVLYAQVDSSLMYKYKKVYNSLSNEIMINGSFKNSVLIVEQFIYPSVKKDDFYKEINYLKNLSELQLQSIHQKKQRFKDSLNNLTNAAIFSVISDTLFVMGDTAIYGHLPYHYNFNDPQGDSDWTNTFVIKLLATHKGNCRSLTYLYKILADELGAKCWLALAPNHIYIRNYSKQIGWYNTELTSGTFPTDAWIAATGYVNPDAIRSGVYMDTLSNQQSIGLCIMDLAQGYIKQTNNYTDSFVLKCCNLVLQYHAVNPEALLTKAEVLKRMYLKQKEEKNPVAQTTYNEMEQVYIMLVKLGYREIPYKAYQKWLNTAHQDKEKYQNKKLNQIIKQKN